MTSRIVITTGDGVKHNVLLNVDITRVDLNKARRVFVAMQSADNASKEHQRSAAEMDGTPDLDLIEAQEEQLVAHAIEVLDLVVAPGQEFVDVVSRRGLPEQIGRVAAICYFRLTNLLATAVAVELDIPKDEPTPFSGTLPPPPTS